MPSLKSLQQQRSLCEAALLALGLVLTMIVTYALVAPVVVTPLFQVTICICLLVLAITWYHNHFCDLVASQAEVEFASNQQLTELVRRLMDEQDDLELVIKLLIPLSMATQKKLLVRLNAAKKESLIRYLNDSIQIQDRWLEISKPNIFTSCQKQEDIWCQIYNEMEDLQQLRDVLTESR